MFIKPRKIHFFAPAVVRLVLFYRKHKFDDSKKKPIFSRSSTIPYFLRNRFWKIHTGQFWTKRFVSRWAVGFKFGELMRTRKPAVYKAKQMRKKKNKMKNKLK